MENETKDWALERAICHVCGGAVALWSVGGRVRLSWHCVNWDQADASVEWDCPAPSRKVKEVLAKFIDETADATVKVST